MSRTLAFRNRQRVRRIDTPFLRRLTLHLLREQLQIADFELAVHLVAAPEMARVNRTFLGHEGSTDVITFDHSETVGQASSLSQTNQDPRKPSIPDSAIPGTAHAQDRLEACPTLHGEIFLSLDDAVTQARQFQTSWQSEVARYVIHGLLHLCGHDDLQPATRRVMKREENRLLREIGRVFALARLEMRNPKRGTRSSGARQRPSAI